MNRPQPRPPTPESRRPPGTPTPMRGQRQRLERDLSRDLAVLIQAGLIAPIGPVAGTSDETLRVTLSETGYETAAGIAMPSAAKEQHGSSGLESGR
jgi:hypothetical protein